MSSKLIPIDPNNIKHIEFLEEFNSNSYKTPIGIIKPQEDNNDISMELLLEEKNNIIDICHLQGVKDMKQCFISCLEKDNPAPKAIIKGTLKGPVVTPPESKARGTNSGGVKKATRKAIKQNIARITE